MDSNPHDLEVTPGMLRFIQRFRGRRMQELQWRGTFTTDEAAEALESGTPRRSTLRTVEAFLAANPKRFRRTGTPDVWTTDPAYAKCFVRLPGCFPFVAEGFTAEHWSENACPERAFAVLCSMLRSSPSVLSNQTLGMRLFNTFHLFSPDQCRQLWTIVKDKHWEERGTTVPPLFVIFSFVTNYSLWAYSAYYLRQQFVDDGQTGCLWFGTCGKTLDSADSPYLCYLREVVHNPSRKEFVVMKSPEDFAWPEYHGQTWLSK